MKIPEITRYPKTEATLKVKLPQFTKYPKRQDTLAPKIPQERRYPKIELTWFDNIKAVKKRPAEMTWATLTALTYRPPVRDNKQDLPWIKLARFGDERSPKGCYRTDKNVLALTGVELDYDNAQLPFFEAVSRLSGTIRCVAYTTPSHTREKPCYRILAPFSHPKEGDTQKLKLLRREMIDKIAALSGQPARESYVLSQAYYFGAVKGREYHHAIINGGWVDNF